MARRSTFLMLTACFLMATALPAERNPFDPGFIYLDGQFGPEVQQRDFNVGSTFGLDCGIGFPAGRNWGLSFEFGSRDVDETVTPASSLGLGQANLQNLYLSFNADWFPAAYFKKDFVPGNSANPDGWVGVPSVNAGLELNRNYQEALRAGGSGELTVLSMLGLDLPVSSFLSFGGSAETSDSFSVGRMPIDSYNEDLLTYQTAFEAHSNLYLDLAGKYDDAERPYWPRIGRVGQVKLSLMWKLGYFGRPSAVPKDQLGELTLSLPINIKTAMSVSVLRDEHEVSSGYWSVPTQTFRYGFSIRYAFEAKRT